MSIQSTNQVCLPVYLPIPLYPSLASVLPTCNRVDAVDSLDVACDGLDAGFLGPDFLVEEVVRLQVQHARGLLRVDAGAKGRREVREVYRAFLIGIIILSPGLAIFVVSVVDSFYLYHHFIFWFSDICGVCRVFFYLYYHFISWFSDVWCVLYFFFVCIIILSFGLVIFVI